MGARVRVPPVPAARYRGVPRVLVEGLEVITVTRLTLMLAISMGLVIGLFLGAWMLGHTLSPLQGILASVAAFCLGVNVGIGLASHE